MNPSERQDRELDSSTRQRRRAQFQHSKETLYEVGNEAPVVDVEETTTTTSTTTTTTPTTTAAVHEEAEPSHNKGQSEDDTNTDEQPQKTLGQIQAEYEAQFPSEPETKRAATTFTLFSDPDSFSPEAIASRTHYLTNSLEGTLWLDADGDGKRGSGLDSTLNALEYDTGIGGVTVSLVKCESNERVSEGISLPNNGVGRGSRTKITEYAEAGKYSFPLEMIESGRYYIMYRAPTNFRISGNILPLGREITEDGVSFTCIPGGGEGIDYLEQVRESGDLNVGGYCARSIGCMEIDKEFNLEDKFTDLQILPGGNEQDWVGTTMNLVALPSMSMGNVGLSEEDWPLSTYQFADAQITLSFPSSVSEDDLSSAVPQDFGKSEVKRNLESTLATMLVQERGESPFAVQGIDISSGDITVPQDAARGLRSLQGETSLSQDITVTYTLTARGSYRPPPFNELGTNVQDSINSNPEGLVKSLKDKGGKLPPLFNNVEGANARHLTLKISKDKPQVLQSVRVVDAPSPGMASWAISPVIVLSILIASLTGIFIFRRVFIFTRLMKVNQHHEDEEKQRSTEPPDVEPMGYLGGGIRVTAVSTESSNDDSKERSGGEHSHHERNMMGSGTSQPTSMNGSRSNRGSGSYGNSGNLFVSSLQSSGQNMETSEQGGGHRRNRKKKKRKTREGGQQVAHHIVDCPPRRSTRANEVSAR